MIHDTHVPKPDDDLPAKQVEAFKQALLDETEISQEELDVIIGELRQLVRFYRRWRLVRKAFGWALIVATGGFLMEGAKDLWHSLSRTFGIGS